MSPRDLPLVFDYDDDNDASDHVAAMEETQPVTTHPIHSDDMNDLELQHADPVVYNKPGYLTTEFWITVATILSATLLVLVDEMQGDDWKWAVMTATGIYTASRAVLKRY